MSSHSRKDSIDFCEPDKNSEIVNLEDSDIGIFHKFYYRKN